MPFTPLSFHPSPTAVVLGVAALLAVHAHAAEFVVDRADDEADAMACTGAPFDCSLRGAVRLSNLTLGTDRIAIPAGTITLSRSGTDEDGAMTGDLDLLDSVEIVGAGSGVSVIDASLLGDRAFHVLVGNPTFLDLAVTGGSTPTGGDPMERSGGGILVERDTVVEDCRVSGNHADDSGGGIAVFDADLSLHDSVVEGNTASWNAGVFLVGDTELDALRLQLLGNVASGSTGGLAVSAGAEARLVDSTVVGNISQGGWAGGLTNYGSPSRLDIVRTLISENEGNEGGLLIRGGDTIVDSWILDNLGRSWGGGFGVTPATGGAPARVSGTTIDGNESPTRSGGIHLHGGSRLLIERSTISFNEAPYGGGVGGPGHIEARNTTISGNAATAGDGGGIEFVEPIHLEHVTLVGNTATGGGSALSWDTGQEYPGTIVSSVIHGECDGEPADFQEMSQTVGGPDNSCDLEVDGLSWEELGLGALDDNGGPTFTHLPLAGSPVLDQGCGETGADQRGYPRVWGSTCDAGSVELGWEALLIDGFESGDASAWN